jgi:hypothetical protein
MDAELVPLFKGDGGAKQDAGENIVFGPKKYEITGNWRYYDNTTSLYFLTK